MGELSVRELPLFPLPEVVLFPQEVLPLHIFESRYRIMLQSVLETDSMFGVIKWDPSTKSMANVGCCAQIIKHQTAEDGRSNIITLGQQRFQILETTPAPIVRPPSRIANRIPCSIATGQINSPVILILSPGITISTFEPSSEVKAVI